MLDINPGTSGSFQYRSDPGGFAEFNGFVYFAARDNSFGRELWRTDGTAANTTRVEDINPGSGSSNPTELTVVDSELFFVANDGSTDTELWKTDGTTTQPVEDIRVGVTTSNPRDLVDFGGTLYFSADDSPASDGSSAVVVSRVRDVHLLVPGDLVVEARGRQRSVD